MTAQEIFYIIASVAMGVFLLAVIGFSLFIYTISRRIHRTARIAHLIIEELHALIRSGRSYSRYFGASVGASILGKILKSLRQE